MFQLSMVIWVACREELGGTRGKEIEVGRENIRKGELMTPLQASEQVWTVQLLLVFSSSGIRKRVFFCRDAATGVYLLSCSAFCAFC